MENKHIVLVYLMVDLIIALASNGQWSRVLRSKIKTISN